MRTVNEVTLLGALGRDAETQFTTGGIAFTKFSVATSRRWKDRQSSEWKEETDWHNVVLWRNEKLSEYLTKGAKVYVRGALRTRSWDKDGERRYTTEVIADQVILLGSKRDSGGHHESAQSDGPYESIPDDDVPF